MKIQPTKLQHLNNKTASNLALFIINDLLFWDMIVFLFIFFTDYSHFMDRITLPSTDTEKGKGKWKIITA